MLLIMSGLLSGCENQSGLEGLFDDLQVQSTSPVAEAGNISTNTIITATFNEPVTPSSVNIFTFTLMQDTTSLPGVVDFRDSTAIFIPDSSLLPNKGFRATITVGVKNISGNSMKEDHVWDFTTGDESQITPVQISGTSPSNNEQNVPANTAVTVRFSEEMNSQTINIATFLLRAGNTVISGEVSYSGAMAIFSPNSLLENGIAYTATITTGAENMSGISLQENYEWSFTTETQEETDDTSPEVSSTNPGNQEEDFNTDQNIRATFTEQIDLSTLTTSSYIVMEGENVIAGTLDYERTTAIFIPNEEFEKGTVYIVTITTDIMDLAGNPLSEDYSWTFRTEEAQDDTPPTVINTDPGNQEEKFATDRTIRATFSEQIDPSTLNTSSYTVMEGENVVAGMVDYDNTTAIFIPNKVLEEGTVYTAILTTEVTDLAGNPLSEDYSWTFRTEEAQDDTPPTVINTDPGNQEEKFATDRTIRATFSEQIDPSTLNTSSYILMEGENVVAGMVDYDNTTAIFIPNEMLEDGTLYTGILTTDVTDLAGNPLSQDYNWTFRTEEAQEDTSPTVINTDPENDRSGVSRNKNIDVFFSEEMNSSSFTTESFVLQRVRSDNNENVSGSISYSGDFARFNPDGRLRKSTDYIVIITTAVTDLAGNPLEENYEFSFKTGKDDDDD